MPTASTTAHVNEDKTVLSQFEWECFDNGMVVGIAVGILMTGIVWCVFKFLQGI